jgi:hypothetical protein
MTAAAKQDTLASAMAAAFAEIEGATKDKVNPHFKSKYADLGSVIDAIKPALVKYGLFFVQKCEPAEDGVCVATVLRHQAGEEMDLGRIFVPANKKDAQGFGSALTYARRYALMTAFGVPAEDDDGNAAAKSAPANDRQDRKPAAQGNGNGTARKDLPFPQGPAKNRTELKTMGREFWRDVEGCGDADQLDILLDSNRELQAQILADLPGWINGYEKDGETYEGLTAVIERKRAEFAGQDSDWRNNPVLAG